MKKIFEKILNPPNPPEIRKDGLCVGKLYKICKEANNCPYLIRGIDSAFCKICGYDDMANPTV